MMTDSDIADEAGRLVFMAKRLAKHVSCEKKLSFLEPMIAKFTYFNSGFLTELDLEGGIKGCADVEQIIDKTASFVGESRLFHYKLHELRFAYGAFRIELHEKLYEKRPCSLLSRRGLFHLLQEPAKPAEPTQQSEPTTDGCGFFASTYCSSAEPTQQPEPTKSAEPTQQPEPTKPAKPTLQPEPTMVIVFVDQRSRLLEEEWAAAKAARQQALVDSATVAVKDATNSLLSAIAQMGRVE